MDHPGHNDFLYNERNLYNMWKAKLDNTILKKKLKDYDKLLAKYNCER